MYLTLRKDSSCYFFVLAERELSIVYMYEMKHGFYEVQKLHRPRDKRAD